MHIGIDIGGTNIRVAASDKPIDEQITKEVIFPNSPDYEANIAQIIAAIGSLATDVSDIGVSTPGSFNEDGSLMMRSTNMPQWVNKPSVTNRLAEKFDCEVAKVNDTESAALGEAVHRASNEPFFFISLGTGISGAQVIYDGEKPVAKRVDSEVQATYFVPWQNDCSGISIEREFSKSGANLSDAQWDVITERFSGHLKTFMDSFMPEHLVFGGGIAVKQWPRLANMLTKFKQKYPEYSTNDFSLTSLGEDAALYGALALQNINIDSPKVSSVATSK